MDNDFSPDACVARGAAVLDARGPANWRSKIDLNILDVASNHNCPLGQIYGAWSTGFDQLQYSESSNWYGFDSYYEHNTGEMEAAWRRLLGEPAPTPELTPRLELTPGLLKQLTELSSQLHDPENPMAVIELELAGVRVALV